MRSGAILGCASANAISSGVVKKKFTCQLQSIGRPGTTLHQVQIRTMMIEPEPADAIPFDPLAKIYVQGSLFWTDQRFLRGRPWS